MSDASFAELLVKFRSDARLSQEALAERAGLSGRTVSDMECGVSRAPRLMTLALLEEALGLAAEDRERLRAAARPAASRPAPSRPAHSIPETLIGRDSEIAHVRDLMRERGARLVTLTGPAGIGKTALALHVARELEAAFQDIVVVELAAIPAAELVASKIASAARVRRLRTDSIGQSIAEVWDGRKVLLVLDNFEHVTQAAAFVGELLGLLPDLHVIATSRIALRLPREREYTLQALAEADCVRLFVERARAVVPSFDQTRDNYERLVRIARRLEGVPLAIELAAPLLKSLSPSAIANRLERLLPVLALSAPVGDPRHGSMRSAIEWSYNLLTPDQQRSLRRMSLLRGAFTLQAAQALIGRNEPADALETLRTLSVLVEHNLLQVPAGEDEPRFEYFVLVREFAEERLHESGDFDRAGEQLAAYCNAVASTLLFRDPETQTAQNFARLQAEYANIDAALSWTCDTGRDEQGLRLCLATFSYWWLRDPAVGLTWMRRLIAAAEKRETPIDEEVFALAYTRATALADQCQELDVADKLAERAIVLRQRLGQELGVAAILNGAGSRARIRGDYPRAFELLKQGLEIRRRVGGPHEVAMSLYELGATAAQQGDTQSAMDYINAGLPALQEVKSQLGVAMSFSLLGLLAQREGSAARARAFSVEALSIAQAIGHAPTIGAAKLVLARNALEEDDLSEAERWTREAIDAYEAAGAQNSMPEVLEMLANIAFVQGRLADAARYLGAAGNQRKREATPVAEPDRERLERLAGSVRSALGRDAFDAEFTIGSYTPRERLMQRA